MEVDQSLGMGSNSQNQNADQNQQGKQGMNDGAHDLQTNVRQELS